MNDLQKFSKSILELLEIIFLSLFFNFSLLAQQNAEPVKPDKALNLSLPLKLCFQYQISGIATYNIASDNASKPSGNNSGKKETASLFIGFEEGRIEKINLSENSPLWISDLGGEITSDIIFEDNKIYLITRILETNSGDKIKDGGQQIKNYILWSLNAETGLTEWQFPFTSEDSALLSSFRDKIILLEKNGNIILIRKSDSKSFPGKNISRQLITPPSVFEDKIYIGVADSSIVVISAENAEVVSKIDDLKSPASNLVSTGENLYWGDKNGFVNLIDTVNSKSIWRVRFGGEISSLSLVPDGVLASSLDNFVYLISLQKGKNVWKRRLAGRISAKPLVSDNFALFITSADNNAVVLDLKDGKVVNQISLADKGFILSAPLIVNDLLVLATNKGLFAYAAADAKCSQNQKE